MTRDERISKLCYAFKHQFDFDKNADMKIDTDDPILNAAVALINALGTGRRTLEYEFVLADTSVDLAEVADVMIEAFRKKQKECLV